MSFRVTFKAYKCSTYPDIPDLFCISRCILYSPYLLLLFQLYAHSSGNEPDILLLQGLLNDLPSAVYFSYPRPTWLNFLFNFYFNATSLEKVEASQAFWPLYLKSLPPFMLYFTKYYQLILQLINLLINISLYCNVSSRRVGMFVFVFFYIPSYLHRPVVVFLLRKQMIE